MPVEGVTEQELADAAQLASLADETPEGRSIVVLAKEKYGLRGREMESLHATFMPFSAQTRMSGVDHRRPQHPQGRRGRDPCPGRSGRASGVARGAVRSPTVSPGPGGTPLAVMRNGRLLGVIHLKDVVKGGIRERFAELRRMGIRTVMITGDNPMTAAAIAAEAGVDDFLAQATPEDKLNLHPRRAGQGQSWSPCAATAPTTPQRWPSPTSASP